MGWLASAMPSPVPCNSRITEVRSLPYAELCCLGDPRYYAALRLPPHHPGFRFGLIPGHASAAIDFADGCGRASPVDRPTFAACHLPYAGAVPGCSRIHGPDCCLRPKAQGSARSVPHGLFFRRGRVHLSCGLQLRFLLASAPDSHPTLEVDFRAPLVACPGGTRTRRSFGPSLGTPLFEPPKRTRKARQRHLSAADPVTRQPEGQECGRITR